MLGIPHFVLPGVKVASVLVRTTFVSGPNSCALWGTRTPCYYCSTHVCWTQRRHNWQTSSVSCHLQPVLRARKVGKFRVVTLGLTTTACACSWSGVWLRHWLLLLSIVRGFPQALQINSKTSTDITPPSLTSRFLLVYYSSITPPYEVHVRLG